MAEHILDQLWELIPQKIKELEQCNERQVAKIKELEAGNHRRQEESEQGIERLESKVKELEERLASAETKCIGLTWRHAQRGHIISTLERNVRSAVRDRDEAIAAWQKCASVDGDNIATPVNHSNTVSGVAERIITVRKPEGALLSTETGDDDFDRSLEFNSGEGPSTFRKNMTMSSELLNKRDQAQKRQSTVPKRVVTLELPISKRVRLADGTDARHQNTNSGLK